ncbi:MAG: UDP-N-acetylglucosamine 1-carboxyvinyltransferase [Ruminococcaceae bacterium]|nr:UDP-N-acetylglucosamine 1-carboxyvinyltransferase [Oscillospiraceae bacterium]
MEKMVVKGGKPLCGEVTVSGAKNAAVAIIPAAILVDGVCTIENVPNIKDVQVIVEILRYMGAEITYLDNYTLQIDSRNIRRDTEPHELMRKMRASYYLIGALLGRFCKANVTMPGGCDFGTRPIDQHIKGFEALGAVVRQDSGIIIAEAEKLVGTNIYLDTVSVGATINVILAATMAEGTTTIENVAKEPHIVDLANFLNAMGAKIKGAGTDVIRITGTKNLKGGTYSIIPDQIEAGTFMVAAAATGGNVLVKNIIPKHMESVSAKLIEVGAKVTEYDDSIRVEGTKPVRGVKIKTLPYPGFPTDMQPQIVALLSVAEGSSIVTEGVWDSRFQYVGELVRMGANIHVEGKTAFITGVEHLEGAPVRATDLRGGAGVIIAGLMAEGVTEITDLKHVDRGYEKIEEKFKALGADICRVSE